MSASLSSLKMNTILLPGGGHGYPPTPVFLPGESHGQRSLEGYSPWGCKQSDRTEVTQHACTHCSSECIHHIFLNHSSVDEHVGGLYILAIVENAIMQMEVQISLNAV